MSDDENARGATTLIEVLDEFARLGFSGDFVLRDLARVECTSCRTTFEVDASFAQGERRLEGASDPDDALLVVALRCPECEAAGTVVAHYGPDSDARSMDLIQQLAPGRPRPH